MKIFEIFTIEFYTYVLIFRYTACILHVYLQLCSTVISLIWDGQVMARGLFLCGQARNSLYVLNAFSQIRRIMFCDTWKLYESQISGSLNKIL